MGVENCKRFVTKIDHEPPTSYKVTKTDPGCGGSSLLCPIPKEFRPKRPIPRKEIIFDADKLWPTDF